MRLQPNPYEPPQAFDPPDDHSRAARLSREIYCSVGFTAIALGVFLLLPALGHHLSLAEKIGYSAPLVAGAILGANFCRGGSLLIYIPGLLCAAAALWAMWWVH